MWFASIEILQPFLRRFAFITRNATQRLIQTFVPQLSIMPLRWGLSKFGIVAADGCFPNPLHGRSQIGSGRFGILTGCRRLVLPCKPLSLAPSI